MIKRNEEILTGKNKMSRPGRYEIRWRGEWVTAKSGIRIMDVCLLYELYDGTTGTAGPAAWRLNRGLRGKTIA